MSNPLELKFLPVKVLLQQAAEGLGVGSQQLYARSSTEIGSLHVREATIKVDFEMTSRAAETQDGVGLGAKTLTFFSRESETRELNRAQIEMRIVTIPPKPEEPPKDAKGTGGGSGTGLPPELERLLDLIRNDPKAEEKLKAILMALAAEMARAKRSGSTDEGAATAAGAGDTARLAGGGVGDVARILGLDTRLAGTTDAERSTGAASGAPAAARAPRPAEDVARAQPATPESTTASRPLRDSGTPAAASTPSPARAPLPPSKTEARAAKPARETPKARAPPAEPARPARRPKPAAPRRTASGTTKQQMADAVRLLRERLLVPDIPPPLQHMLAHDLEQISHLLDADLLEEAEVALQRFAAAYTDAFRAFGEEF